MTAALTAFVLGYAAGFIGPLVGVSYGHKIGLKNTAVKFVAGFVLITLPACYIIGIVV